MPVYEYLCRDCQKEFEVVQSLPEHDKGGVACPDCESKKVERRYTHTHVEAITSKKS